MTPGVSRVVCAAVKMPNGVLILGIRHWDGFMAQYVREHGGRQAFNFFGRDEEQGFVDQFGNFLSREDAWKVAEQAGQIIRRVGGDGGCLYSENLY